MKNSIVDLKSKSRKLLKFVYRIEYHVFSSFGMVRNLCLCLFWSCHMCSEKQIIIYEMSFVLQFPILYLIAKNIMYSMIILVSYIEAVMITKNRLFANLRLNCYLYSIYNFCTWLRQNFF